MYYSMHVGEVSGQLLELVLSYCVGWGSTSEISLGSKHLYPSRHLTNFNDGIFNAYLNIISLIVICLLFICCFFFLLR